MATFLIGLAVLAVGGFFYGGFIEKIMKPDKWSRTPAFRLRDDVDYVPLSKTKNALIQLLNIAGTGPILGPVQGILFGPIAFITIPIGCLLGGAMHDYMSGMVSVRNNGKQMPALIKQYLGKVNYGLYVAFVCLLLVLVGTVFIYTPGDIFASQVLKTDTAVSNPTVWIIFAVIFGYYLIATLFPIDKIIGKIYPFFGALLILSTVGVFIGIFAKGYQLNEVWEGGLVGLHPEGLPFVPIFFVTVACGIVSGFHSTQSTMIARTMANETHGRGVFFNMMVAESFIAMIWAAAAMGIFNNGLSTSTAPTAVIGIIARDLLGEVGGIVAILGIVVLAITSGDTALRSLRIMSGDFLNIDQTKPKNRLLLSGTIFVMVAGLLVFAKFASNGFNVLWRYFAWANQTISLFAFAMITIYLVMRGSRYFFIALLPGMFYCFVVSSYILNARIGFNLSWTVSYIIAAVLTAAYAGVTVWAAKKRKNAQNALPAVSVAE